jgi:PST family polysaccharide transporter
LTSFDTNPLFSPLTGGEGLRRRAVRSAGVTVFAQVVAFSVQMIATIVLARLLVPADFGLVAMVTTFSLLLSYVGVIGFPEAILQREEIDRFLASNLFWINMAVGTVLSVGFAAAGSLLAKFYGDPRVERVTFAVSITIFLSCISVIHLALLKRAMRFSAVSMNDIIARVASVLISIVLALAGWGYWALVAGVIAQPLSTAVGAWILCGWVPSLPRRVPTTGSMIRFATHVYGSFSIDYCTHNLDNLLVGWRFGSLPLGFYKKAYELFVLPANQFLSAFPVAVSTLSRLKRDRMEYRRYLLAGISILAFAGMGIGGDLTLVGKDVVRLLLGPQWAEAGKIFTFFGPGIGIMLVYRTQGMVHLSLGTTSRFFRWAMIEFAVTSALFFLALRWGPSGIAVAWTMASWVLVFPAFWYATRPMQFAVGDMLATVWKFILASLLAGGGCYAIVHTIPALAARSGASGALLRIVSDTLLFGGLYVGMVVLLHGGLQPLRQIVGLLREMAPSGMFAGNSETSVLQATSGVSDPTVAVAEAAIATSLPPAASTVAVPFTSAGKRSSSAEA